MSERYEDNNPQALQIILELHKEGKLDTEISESTGINRRTICDIRNRQGLAPNKRKAWNKTDLNNLDHRRIEKTYLQLKNIEGVEKKLGIGRRKVVKSLESLGYRIFSQKLYHVINNNNIVSGFPKIIPKMWKNGDDLIEILRALGINENNNTELNSIEESLGIKSLLKKARSNDFRINNLFEKITPYSAYVEGYFLADGHLIEKDFEVGFTTVDNQSVFRGISAFFLGLDKTKIDTYNSSEKSITKRLSIRNKRLFLTMESLGYMPRKTYHGEKLVKIFENYDENLFDGVDCYPYFLRGFFDGDGIIINEPKGNVYFGFIGDGRIISYIKKSLAKRIGIKGSLKPVTKEEKKTMKLVEHSRDWEGSVLIYNNTHALDQLIDFIYQEPDIGKVPRGVKFDKLIYMQNLRRYYEFFHDRNKKFKQELSKKIDRKIKTEKRSGIKYFFKQGLRRKRE